MHKQSTIMAAGEPGQDPILDTKPGTTLELRAWCRTKQTAVL